MRDRKSQFAWFNLANNWPSKGKCGVRPLFLHYMLNAMRLASCNPLVFPSPSGISSLFLSRRVDWLSCNLSASLSLARGEHFSILPFCLSRDTGYFVTHTNSHSVTCMLTMSAMKYLHAQATRCLSSHMIFHSWINWLEKEHKSPSTLDSPWKESGRMMKMPFLVSQSLILYFFFTLTFSSDSWLSSSSSSSSYIFPLFFRLFQ